MSDAAGHRLTTLPSGVRVVSESVPGVRSVALGALIAAGSSTEPARQAGWSHLLEHMLFRGTARYGSAEIDEIFDAMGAELNAGTDRESTSVYSRVQDRHLGRAFDVMADMIWRPRIAAEDLAAEREIVLEEIAMYEDDPQEQVFDVLGEAVFGEHPLGRPVVGSRATVADAQDEVLRAFHAERYVSGDLVIAAAGSIDHDALVGLVAAAEEQGASDRAPSPPPAPPADRAPAVRFVAKPTEQYHVTLGALGLARSDERRFALRALDVVLGGTPSSRLFQEIREKRALAYSVSSFHSELARTGQVGIYLGTRPENVGSALEALGGELDRLCEDGVKPAELDRAREHVKGRIVLGLESTSARMSRLGATVLARLPVLSIEELLERIDAVDGEQVDALARELFASERMSVAAIGPDEGCFRASMTGLRGERLEVG